MPKIHMISFRKPATFFLIKDKNAVRETYAIESDKGFFSVFPN